MPILLAGTVMDKAAAYMNDAALSIYTYVIQIPYLNGALQELQELFELNEVPVVDTISTVIEVLSGIDHIGFAPDPPLDDTPYLPDDLIEPQVLWERTLGINPYIPMTRVDVLPRYMEGIEINQFIYYVWQSQEIRFFPSNQNNDIKMDYIRNLFTPVEDEDGEITVINAQSFLEYRTAALLAQFCGENKSRADELNLYASLAIDRVVGIGTKGRQAINTRHRPFRSSFKRRSYM